MESRRINKMENQVVTRENGKWWGKMDNYDSRSF